MGMDVHGKNPVNEAGEYFRNNVWWWRPLATFIVATTPHELTSQCEYWQSNDGAGLDAEGSKQLAFLLRKSIEDGSARAYVKQRDECLAARKDETCDICDGTGSRAKPPKRGAGSMPCNKCNGVGKVRPTDTWYHLDLDNISKFAEFCEYSGGFEIC